MLGSHRPDLHESSWLLDGSGCSYCEQYCHLLSILSTTNATIIIYYPLYLLIVCWYSYSSSIQPFLRERTGALYTSPCEIRNVLIYREEVGKNEASVLVSGRQCRAKSGSCLSRTVQRVILWKMTAVSITFHNVARWVYLMVSKSVSDSSFPQQDKKSNHCSLGRWNSFSSGYL